MKLSERTKRWVSVTVRIVVTLALLGWLGRSIDFSTLKQLLIEVDAAWVTVACVAILVARFLIALRWKILLGAYGIHLPLWTLSKVIFISMFAGQFLPGVVGTDVVRGYKVAKTHGRAGTVALTLLLDRVIGIYAMSVVAVIGAVIGNLSEKPTGLLLVMLSFLAALMVGGAAGLFLVRRIRSLPWFRGTRAESLWTKITALATTGTNLVHHRPALAAVFAVSLGIVMVRCLMFFSLYRAFGAPVPLDSLMVFIPMMFVAVLIPLSVGGLGIRETALVYLLRTIGIPAEVSVSVGLMFHFLQVVTSSPGIVFWLTERKSGALGTDESAQQDATEQN